MFDKTDILKRLQNGDTVDAIAQEMADVLNAAASEKRELDAQKEVEEKALKAKCAEEERIYAAKREAVCCIIDGFSDFLMAGDNEDLLASLQNVDVDKMVRVFDEMIECAQGLGRLAQLQFPKVKQKVTVRSDDEVLKQFLKDMFG
jgi:uncharacterized protein (DUF4415 family)